jgi:hypothetical protein
MPRMDGRNMGPTRVEPGPDMPPDTQPEQSQDQ